MSMILVNNPMISVIYKMPTNCNFLELVRKMYTFYNYMYNYFK